MFLVHSRGHRTQTVLPLPHLHVCNITAVRRWQLQTVFSFIFTIHLIKYLKHKQYYYQLLLLSSCSSCSRCCDPALLPSSRICVRLRRLDPCCRNCRRRTSPNCWSPSRSCCLRSYFPRSLCWTACCCVHQ